MSDINLAAWVPCTQAEGPGNRSAVWVQVTMNPRLAMVEDHPLVLQGLESLLRAHRDYDIAYSGPDLRQALALDPPVDLLLLDLDLGLRGAMADPTLVAQARHRGTEVLVVSALGTPAAIRAMLDVGVAGFVSKAEPPQVLLEAIDTVLAGGTWTSTQVAIAIFSDTHCPTLSDQEHHALMLYASGLKLDAVAHEMNVSTSSAKTYLDRVRAKYAAVGRPVASKIDLYREARRDGYVPD